MDTHGEALWVQDRGTAGEPSLVPLAGPGTAAVTESGTVRAALVAEIRAAGPITFARFMERCLYAADGYYASRAPVGQHGDYLTSPELHPLFGALIGRQVEEMWAALGRPHRLTLVEMGAGNGTLLRGLLAATQGRPLGGALRPVLIEPFALNRATQAAVIGAWAERLRWVDSLAALESEPLDPGVVISNELLDSFPVHRVRVTDGRLRELYVGLEGDRFVELEGDPSTPELPRYFGRLGLLPGDGCTAEVNLRALAWMRSVASVLRRGFVLTLDYGYPATQLYAPWRRDGTLLCYHGHTVTTDPFARIGRQDITAHVDFTSLAAAGKDAELQPLGLVSQRDFLAALGIGEALAGGPAVAPSLEEYLSRRRAVEALLNAEGLGRIRVLAQARGVEGPRLHAFAGAGND